MASVREIIREEVIRMLAEARIEVVKNEFVNSHGKEPKGTGNWAFRLETKPRGKDGEVIWPSTGRGTMKYTDALKLAKQEAKETGATYIVVMP